MTPWTPRPAPRRPYAGWDIDPLYVEPEPVRREPVRVRTSPYLLIAVGTALVVIATMLMVAKLAPPRSAPVSVPEPSGAVRLSGPIHTSVALRDDPRSASNGAREGAGSPGKRARSAAGQYPADRAIATAQGAIGEPAVAVSGWATYYPTCRRCAAAGPLVKDMLGRGWKGDWVRVSAGDRSVVVRLVTGCACGDRHGDPTVIDLSPSAFARLAPLGQGIVRVIVEPVDAPPRLPETDTAP